jgi:hypothetical protein
MTPAKKPVAKETVKIETVTPAMARRWLEGNVDNRRLRETRVVYYARMLTDDEWSLSPDAIAFDDQGVLINGQHRLSAVVVADAPARFIILRGVPAATQEIMDQNLSRSLADQLHRRGISNVHVVAGAVKWLHQMAYTEETGNVHYQDDSVRPSLRELLTVFEKNQELIEQAPTIGRLRYYTKVRPGPTLAIKHRLAQIDPDETELFYERWTEGTGLQKSDPIWRLREWCISDARTRHTSGRAPSYRYVAYVFKAWNLWRDGMTTLRLNWVYTPTKRESWPIPH